MSSSGSDETGVTEDVRVRMLEEENIKLKSQILTLQEQFTKLSKINFEQTTRNMSLRIMIKKEKSKIRPSLEEIPIVEKESENSDILEEDASIMEMADIAAEIAGDNGQADKNIWSSDISEEAASIAEEVADIAAESAGDDEEPEVAKNIWKQSNCLEDDMFEEMEENEKFVEDTNVMKVWSKIENVSGQSRIKKPDDSERDKLLEYIEKEEGNTLMYRCIICDKTSKNKYLMKDHVESVHFPGMFSYPCNFCDNIFSTKQSFRRHKKLHNTEPVSDLPQKGTDRNNSVLSDNIEIVDIDSNVFVFRCKICGKINAQKSNLMDHIESVHFPGSYMYWCEACMKTFGTRASFYWHMKANHKETIKAKTRNKKINEREECVMRDDTKSSVPIFRCNMCDYANIRRDQVRNHVERKHCLQNS